MPIERIVPVADLAGAHVIRCDSARADKPNPQLYIMGMNVDVDGNITSVANAGTPTVRSTVFEPEFNAWRTQTGTSNTMQTQTPTAIVGNAEYIEVTLPAGMIAGCTHVKFKVY